MAGCARNRQQLARQPFRLSRWHASRFLDFDLGLGFSYRISPTAPPTGHRAKCEMAQWSGRKKFKIKKEENMAFDALEKALQLAATLRSPLERIKQYDKSLADQARRAATRIVLCLSEGRQRTGKDKLHLFRIAAGSAAEVKNALQLALAWGFLIQLHSNQRSQFWMANWLCSTSSLIQSIKP